MMSADYRDVIRVLDVLDDNRAGRSGVDLCSHDEVAVRTGLRVMELDALFARWAGVDLTRFLQSLTIRQIRQRLLGSADLIEKRRQQELPAGAGSNRVQVRFWPPGSGRKAGAGMTIRYTLNPTPFGNCLLAVSEREICWLSFVDSETEAPYVDALRRVWPQARIVKGEEHGDRQKVEQIFLGTQDAAVDSLAVLVKGTDFQMQVWQALLALPLGAMISYQDLALALGRPTACRAVASAVAANPVSYLLPCHRVIRQSGEIHHYRWGGNRKRVMLGWEACRL